jgi:hypothetical protein
MSHLVLCDKVVSYSGNLLRIEPKSVHKKRIIGMTDDIINSYLQVSSGSKIGDGNLFLRLTGGEMTFAELYNSMSI